MSTELVIGIILVVAVVAFIVWNKKSSNASGTNPVRDVTDNVQEK